MRVSTQMFADNYLNELSRHQEQLYRLQQQAASGKRLLDPSDDPASARQALLQRATLDANQQYQANLGDARTVVEHSESVVKSLVSLVDRAHELALRGASDNTTPDGRAALANEINQLIEESADHANDHTLGRYTFAGINTGSEPYTVTRDGRGKIISVSSPPAATAGEIDRQVGANSLLKVNLNGSDIFGSGGAPSGSVDYFSLLTQMRDALQANNADTVRLLLPQLDKLHDQVQTQATLADARAQRLQQTQQTLEQQGLEAQSALSQLEDVDVAKVAVELQAEQNAYQQALQVGNRILSLGLGNLLG